MDTTVNNKLGMTGEHILTTSAFFHEVFTVSAFYLIGADTCRNVVQYGSQQHTSQQVHIPVTSVNNISQIYQIFVNLSCQMQCSHCNELKEVDT